MLVCIPCNCFIYLQFITLMFNINYFIIIFCEIKSSYIFRLFYQLFWSFFQTLNYLLSRHVLALPQDLHPKIYKTPSPSSFTGNNWSTKKKKALKHKRVSTKRAKSETEFRNDNNDMKTMKVKHNSWWFKLIFCTTNESNKYFLIVPVSIKILLPARMRRQVRWGEMIWKREAKGLGFGS